MQWLKKFGISLTIVFFAVCCGAVLLFNWSAFGWKALSVPTGSMRPTIPPGSLVLMHSVPISSLKVGDVITYTSPASRYKTITHRIIKTYTIDHGKVSAFITKGDANPTADPAVVAGQVLGKAVWHVPDIGGWLSWSKTWVGLAVLVYVPAFLLMIEEVQRLSEYYRKSQPYIAVQKLVRKSKERRRKLVPVSAVISLALVAVPILMALPAQALLISNTVTLGPNNLKVASITPPTQCTGNSNSTTVTVTGTGNSNNNISVNNSSSQSASSGNVNVSGNTSVGSVSSGNASNSNCTDININIH